MKTLLVITSIFVSVFLSAASIADARIVSINGKAEFEVEPDIIELDFSVSNTKQKTVEQAKTDVDQRSADIVSALIKLGILETDIRSRSFEVNTEQRYQNNNCPDAWHPHVSRNIEIKLRDISKYQALLDALVKNGVTRINSVRPQVSNLEKMKQKALSLAIEDAKQQAHFLASSFDAKVGKVYQIGERRIHENNYFAERATRSGLQVSSKQDIPYQFKPSKISINADIYVEFLLD